MNESISGKEEHKVTDSAAAPPVATPLVASATPQATATSAIKAIEQTTVWIMILSAIALAIVSILAIWGLLGQNVGDVIGRSLGTIAVIAFVALVVNVGANLLDQHSKKK